MEQLLHYVWKHKIFPLKPLRTTDGQTVEVIDPGIPNADAGLGFFNAKLKIGGVLWVGNVELHLRASAWQLHGHARDAAFNNVILHVVGVADCEVYTSMGDVVPQLVLACPEEVRLRYDELRQTEIYPPCYSVLPLLPDLSIHSWLSALQVERFERKTRDITARLERHGNHWEDVFFITLSRNFGFGLNGEVFEAWASRLPFRAADKHRDNLFQVEALFFGTAGLLEEESDGDDGYYAGLRREFRYLKHKFELPDPMPAERWRFLRSRPGNFPHVRLAQLAWLYHKEQSLFSRVMAAETPLEAERLFAASTSPYWEEHFIFRKLSPRRKKYVGKNALNLILINTVVPFLYAYGVHKADERLCLRATCFLEGLKAEDNRVTRLWSGAGLAVSTAADSQALLQLQREYCERKECLRCRFGYEYLKAGGNRVSPEIREEVK